MYGFAVERHPFPLSMALPRLARLLAICLVIFRATFAAAQTPPIATVGLTAGWATFGQAVPQGAGDRRPAVGNLADADRRQEPVARRLDSLCHRHGARATAGGDLPVTPAAAVERQPSRRRGPTPRSPDDRRRSPTRRRYPTAASADIWLSGPLVHEDRHVVTPVTGQRRRASVPPRELRHARVQRRPGRVDVSVENMLDMPARRR